LKAGEPGSGKYWSDKNRTWQFQCGSCHSTGVKINYDAAKNTFKTTWVDNGVSCEACHGPGSVHAAEPRYKKTATIINPAKIPDARRAAQTCGQCHNRGTSVSETKVPIGPKYYEFPNGQAGYLPGKVLENYYNEKPGLWPDGSSRQHHQEYNDWAKSKHADAGVNCWDCHKVHGKGIISKHSLKEAGDKLCLTCHSVQDQLMHSIHGSNSCTECHMTKTAMNAVKTGPSRYDIASHTFRVVSPAETIKQGGLEKQPNSCNACHYHANDKPEDLLKVYEAVRNKKLESMGLEKKSSQSQTNKK
jgi:predicted CXXCH cytochrome family protein